MSVNAEYDASLATGGCNWHVKDGGGRETYGDMLREPAGDRVDYTLALDGPMFERYAAHLTAGAKKYPARNWLRCTQADRDGKEAAYARFRESALRHMVQYMAGDTSEDHAAAIWFNLNGAELLRPLLKYTPEDKP